MTNTIWGRLSDDDASAAASRHGCDTATAVHTTTAANGRRCTTLNIATGVEPYRRTHVTTTQTHAILQSCCSLPTRAWLETAYYALARSASHAAQTKSRRRQIHTGRNKRAACLAPCMARRARPHPLRADLSCTHLHFLTRAPAIYMISHWEIGTTPRKCNDRNPICKHLISDAVE